MDHLPRTSPEPVKPLRVYLSHPVLESYQAHPLDLNPIARVQLQMRNVTNLPDAQSVLASHFTLVDSPQAAHIHLLPFTWNWYLREAQMQLVAEAVSTAQTHRKPVVLFSEGDFTANVPFSGLTIFEASAYRSRRHQNGNKVFAKPSFIPDFVALYCNGDVPLRQKRERPVVGFCGLAGGRWYQLAYRLLKLEIAKVAFHLGTRQWEPPPFEPSLFRRNALLPLCNDKRVVSHFIFRNRYRAGYRAKKKDPFHPTRMEYVRNMLESDYIVCLRGGGNYSVRFYETLSMGRIPVFVDTDCILPYDHLLDYRKFVVWVDGAEMSRIAENILDFHAALSSEAFVQLQLDCRELWRSYLSEDGFWQHFATHFFGSGHGKDGPP